MTRRAQSAKTRAFFFGSLFTRLFCLFLLLILFCVLIPGVCSSVYFSQTILRETENSQKKLLMQAKNQIDQRYLDLKDLAMQISLFGEVEKARFYGASPTPQQMETYKKIVDYLAGLTVSNSYVKNIWLYYKNADIIVNSSGKYSRAGYFSIYGYENSAAYEEYFRSGVVFTTLGPNRLSSQTKILSFAAAVPFNDPESDFVIVIDIDESVFRQMVDMTAGELPSLTLIRNRDGTDIVEVPQHFPEAMCQAAEEAFRQTWAAQPPKQETFTLQTAGGSFRVLREESVLSGYEYLSVISTSYVWQKAAPILLTSSLFMLLTLALGVLFAYLISKRLYEPVCQILDYINVNRISGVQRTERSELGFINRFLQAVYRQNGQLRQDLEEARPLVREKILCDALNGHIKPGSAEYLRFRQYSGFTYPCYQAVTFQVSQREESFPPGENLSLREVLLGIAQAVPSEGYPGLRFAFLHGGEGILHCIANSEPQLERPDIIYEYIDELRHALCAQLEVSCSVGIGHRYSDLCKLGESCAESLFALRFTIQKGENTVIHIDEVGQLPQTPFYYPMETENRIINCLKAGDFAATRQRLCDTVSQNIARGCGPAELENLFVVLHSTAVRALFESGLQLEELSAGNSYVDIQKEDSVFNKQEVLLALCRRICTRIIGSRTSQNERVYRAIVEYIEQHYAEDISLNILEERLKLSSSYLSYIFKQVAGENFVDYLNRYRLGKAKELLRTTNESASAISLRCGFATPNNFSRVFKKYEGVTPGKYRHASL